MNLDPKILVVEDDEEIQDLIRHMLSGNLANEILTASSMKKGLEILKCETNIGLILADYKLPSGDGLDFLAEVRELGMSVPFVILTGYDHIYKDITKRDLYPNDIASKPISNDELLYLVQSNILSIGQKNDSLIEGN